MIDQLSDGLVTLCEKRGIQRIKGHAVFENSEKVRVYESDVGYIKFQHAVIATGSTAIALPKTEFKKGSRIMNSAGALELPEIPDSMLIVGGGYVGLEIGSVYASLGTRIVLVKQSDRLITGADKDIIKPLQKRLENLFESIHFNTSVKSLSEDENGVEVKFRGESFPL